MPTPGRQAAEGQREKASCYLCRDLRHPGTLARARGKASRATSSRREPSKNILWDTSKRGQCGTTKTKGTNLVEAPATGGSTAEDIKSRGKGRDQGRAKTKCPPQESRLQKARGRKQEAVIYACGLRHPGPGCKRH